VRTGQCITDLIVIDVNLKFPTTFCYYLCYRRI